MIYQVRANIYFDEEDEARDFFHDCELAFPKGIAVNSGMDNGEYSTIELIENHHDEDPNAACSLVEIATNEPY